MSYRNLFYNSLLMWNWQQRHWPEFKWDPDAMAEAERVYSYASGKLIGVFEHLSSDDKNEILIGILTTEGVKTAEIEGEYLNRDSVQSSIRRKLGLSGARRHVEPAEAGMAEMMTGVYLRYKRKLTHRELHRWNFALTQGRTDLENRGAYRIHPEPMQVVSGGMGMEKVYFEAPPSGIVKREMDRFVRWFNDSQGSIPPLTRAGIAHLYSVCIHPYEDGNGRMARALAEKSLSQSAGFSAVFGISREIMKKKKAYYDALQRNNQSLEITGWLLYFSGVILKASENTLRSVERVLQKADLYRRHSKVLNERQKKILDKLFLAEPEGYEGGLSAGNALRITNASRATVTRDLHELVELGILRTTGSLRHMRYWLNK